MTGSDTRKEAAAEVQGALREEKEGGKFQVVRVAATHTFNPSTQEAEAEANRSLRPAWSTEWVSSRTTRVTQRNKLANKAKAREEVRDHWRGPGLGAQVTSAVLNDSTADRRMGSLRAGA